MPVTYYSACAVCGAYFTNSTEAMVRESFKAHDCKRRHRINIEGTTMTPMEEAGWVARQLSAQGAKPVFA